MILIGEALFGLFTIWDLTKKSSFGPVSAWLERLQIYVALWPTIISSPLYSMSSVLTVRKGWIVSEEGGKSFKYDNDDLVAPNKVLVALEWHL